MNEYFLSLFKNNTSLSYEDRIKLVASSKGLLVFDAVFASPVVQPRNLAAILQKYGWLWVSIDADPSSGRSQHAVVVNDVSAVEESSQAKVQYYDVADGKIHNDNFTDFVQRVKQGALLPSHLDKAVIRLAISPHQGAKPNPLLKDTQTRHQVFLEAIDWAFAEYKNKQQHTNLFKVSYELFGSGAKKDTRLVLWYDKNIDAEVPPQITLFSKTLNADVTLPLVQLVDTGLTVTGLECEYKPTPTTIRNLWRWEKPVYGGVRVVLRTSSSAYGGTVGGWFRDMTNGGAPVVMTNAHVLKFQGAVAEVISSDPDLGIIGLGYPAFTTLRMGTSDRMVNRDMGIAAPVHPSFVPADMSQNGAEIVWGSKRYKTGTLKSPAVGDKVMKIGSQTGLTTAVIQMYEVECIDRSKSNTPFTEPSNFIPRFEMTNANGCAADGDSGSIVISAKANASTSRYDIVGLLYRGHGSTKESNCMDTVAGCFPIQYVCDQLQLAPF